MARYASIAIFLALGTFQQLASAAPGGARAPLPSSGAVHDQAVATKMLRAAPIVPREQEHAVADSVRGVVPRIKEAASACREWIVSPAVMLTTGLARARAAKIRAEGDSRAKGAHDPSGDPESLSAGGAFMRICMSILVQALLIAIVGFLYMKNKPASVVDLEEGSKKESLDGKFKHGLFSFHETPRLSVFTFLCCGIRWADSMRMLGELTFISAIAIWLGVEVLGAILGGIFGWLMLAAVGMMYRQKIRKAFGMPSSTYLMSLDFASWLCCMCCTIVQETRQVEEAKILEHDAVKNEKPLTL
mmetsp:Transcript_54982/g.153329  ORF Transcript_54982/g.153329 Transcript_54982/m.153329 type:complete len:303 (+) Transcript_54982:80-988(+)